jgi:L-2,4-diaminobutyrate decarboxylase
VPFPSSILFVRQWDDFGRVTIYADYFNRRGEPEPNPGLKSLPSTRPFSALHLVASLRHQGMDQVRASLRAPLTAIRSLAEYIREQDDLELCHQPDTGILCFRVTPPGSPEAHLNELQRYLYDRLLAGGERTLSRTKLDGKAVLRLVAVSPWVTFEHMLETIAAVRELASEF